MTATNQGSKIGGLKQISGETPVFHPFFPFLGNRFSTKNRGRPWTFPKLWPPPDDWKALEKRHQKSKSTTKVTWRRLIVSLYFCSCFFFWKKDVLQTELWIDKSGFRVRDLIVAMIQLPQEFSIPSSYFRIFGHFGSTLLPLYILPTTMLRTHFACC